MRFSIAVAIATLSATVLAQGNVANIPTCAQNCFSNADLGDCSSILDVACVCKSAAITEVSCCALASCSQADIQTTITFATTLCQGEGVTLNTSPNCGSNSSSSASVSSSASAAASASSSAAVTAISGTNTASGSATRSASGAASSGSAAATAATGAGAFQTAGPVLGLGVAVVGLLAAL